MRVEESIEIGRPLKEVFDYVSEPDNFPEWTGTAIEVRKGAPGPVREGDTFKAAGSRRPTRGPPTSLTGSSRSELRAARSLIRSGPTPSRRCREVPHALRGRSRGSRGLLQAGRSAHRAGTQAPGQD